MKNTKARNEEIAHMTANEIRKWAKEMHTEKPSPFDASPQDLYDGLNPASQSATVRVIAKAVETGANCHYTTAKRHVVRQLRGEKGKWGGFRPGSGRPATSGE